MITEKFRYIVPQESDDQVVDEHIAMLYKQFLEWNDKLEKRRADKRGMSIAYYWVTRTDGGDIKDVPRDVLINAADGWCYNFGGKVSHYTKDNSAYVHVYVD